MAEKIAETKEEHRRIEAEKLNVMRELEQSRCKFLGWIQGTLYKGRAFTSIFVYFFSYEPPNSRSSGQFCSVYGGSFEMTFLKQVLIVRFIDSGVSL